MELKKLMEIQDNFDKEHSSIFDWSTRITESNIEILEFLLICITGEVGELANVIKKIIRGDFPLSATKEKIEEELTDVFIYLIKICNQMEIDLEENFLKKVESNRVRFQKYQK